MCGRYVLETPLDQIAKQFDVAEIACDDIQSYNVAPTQEVLAIIDANGQRRLGKLQWGLIPSWSKDAAIGSKMINARSETLHEKASFKVPFRKKRCLIIANGFYEWQKQGDQKTPMYVRLKSKLPFAMAGLYESWESPDGERISTCTIITTQANSLLKDIHHRMPVILDDAAQSIWLDRSVQDPTTLQPLLKPYPPDKMDVFAVSTAVNSVKNDSPDLIEPVQS